MSNDRTAVAERDTRDYKLPTAVTPKRYDIKLTPDLQKFTFAGEETIHVSVNESTNEILLNAVELEIQSATISNGKGNKHSGKISLEADKERARITFPEKLGTGDWTLELKFTGILNDKLNGFYRSTYKDGNGNQKVLATTQFEATDARKAFPCWDEPQHKAVFGVTLVVDAGLTAISNASIKTENVLSNAKKEVIFNDTIKMSTYLVAFIVGEFEGTEPIIADGKPIRIFAIPGKKHLANFAKDIAKASLEFFANYYGISYPGDKLDLIAIPDFASGAMENLGAVTFRETALLVDDKTATHAELERVADVVAHELAHMWFGDLVTMEWWNGLWLNEAFATFMEMLAVDHWKPNWKRWESFGVSRAAAFAVDGLKSTRPIEFPVRHPDEASAMFDVLTYEKGASVLRMLEQYLGESEFKKGIANYLKKHEYANAETTDLWDALEESTGQPVRQLMDSWIFQGGFPLVSVELDAKGTGVNLSQQRFFYLPGEKASDQLFHVPIMLKAKTANGMVTKKLILKDRTTHVDLVDKIDWVIINEGGHGFYRVRLSSNLLQALTAHLFKDVAPIERFGLVSDTWASVVAGHTPAAEYLKMALLFREETDKNVWALILGSLHYLNKVISEDQRPTFSSYVRKLLEPALQRLGWEAAAEDSALTKQLRGMVIGAMGTIGDDNKVQKVARELYQEYKRDKALVDPNIVPALISILSYIGGSDEYKEFEKEFKAAQTPQEEQRYLFALAGFRDTALLNHTLELSINGEVRTQNAPYLLQSVMANVKGREMAWEFMKKNWDTMNRIYPENSIPRMCEGVTNLVCPKLEEDVKAFFAKHPVKQGGKTIDQHLEKLRVAVMFKQREEKNLSRSLDIS